MNLRDDGRPHGHHGSFDHTCEHCLDGFWEDAAFERIKKGDKIADAAQAADEALAELLAQY